MDATRTSPLAQARPFLGHGVGLRVPHYARALERGLDVDWLEAISENFLRPGGRPLAVLERVRREVPVVLHGVGLGVGSVAPLDRDYLARLRALADRIEPAWLSDHLCFGRVEGHHAHDLLPLPYTEEALALVVERVAAAQDALGRRVLLENVSSYVGYAASAMPEWEFLAEVARRADCLILLDLNNVVVSAVNHGFEPRAYLDGVPGERVWQFHLANHDVRENHRFDSHRGAVPDEVWALYRDALARYGAVSSLVEWDEDVPAWEVLKAEQVKAKAIAEEVLMTSTSLRSPARGGHAGGTESPPANAVALSRGGLEETQRLFWEVITHPTGATAFAATNGAGPIDETFLETPAFSRLERLELYADAYFWRLFGVLREMFPLIEARAGRERFHDLITDYLLHAPSTAPDIGQIGARLPGFLATHALERAHPGLAELATVEWALADALHGADDPPATREALGAIPLEAWPTTRFRAVATARLVECRHDALTLRRALDRGAPLPSPPRTPAGRVLVWRRGFVSHLRAVAEAELAALERLIAGAPFDELCAVASDPSEAAARLARWVDDELLAAPVLPTG